MAASGGKNLRLIRQHLDLTMHDVEHATVQIAERRGSTEYLIPPSRLSDIETKDIIPSIYRFYSLSVVYHQDIRKLMSFYGVDLNQTPADMNISVPTKSHISEALATISAIHMPIRLDPGFDPGRTANFSRVVERWGTVPVSYLEQFLNTPYAYGYIGSEDLTMYPILLPGSFVQIDKAKRRVVAGGWRSEYSRPIYFVETRDGYTCCWCTVARDEIILQPHSLSPVSARILQLPQEAEVLGQVVGCAMTLGGSELTGSANIPDSPVS